MANKNRKEKHAPAKRIGEEEYLGAMLREFPKISRDHAEGLYELTISFGDFTVAAAKRSDETTVRRCYEFMDRMLRDADDDVFNAIHVSFLEHLPIRTGKEAGIVLKRLLTTRLLEGWEYMDKEGFTR